MPACTACGNHLSTDYLRVFGDNDGGLESCPNCAAGWDAAEPSATAAAPAGPAARNGAAPKPSSTNGSTDAEAPTPDRSSDAELPRADGSTDVELPRADGSTDAESPDDEGPEFTVKTAGRSLEPPREQADAWGSRTERSTSARKPDRHRPSRGRDRSPSILSSVLDVFR